MCRKVLFSYKTNVNFPYKVIMRWTPGDYHYKCHVHLTQTKKLLRPVTSATPVNSVKLMSFMAKPISY